MERQVYYSTNSFRYVKEEKTFYGVIDDIYPVEGSQIPFPTEKKQFYLKNPKTGEFRRFSFQKELQDNSTLYYVFKSDDDLYVSVLVEVYSNEINITEN
jgi:hypothetical protein